MTLQDIIFAMSEVYNQTLSKNSVMQSVAEDVEYEDVSESECEMIETSNNGECTKSGQELQKENEAAKRSCL